MSDPFTVTLMPVIDGALRFATAGLETYQARLTARTRDQDRQVEAAQREADRQEARQHYIQSRRDTLEDEIRALRATRELDLYRLQLQHYPVTNGPGSLRESIRLIFKDPQVMPPLVLVVPPHSDSDEKWRPLTLRLSAALMPLQEKGLVVARRTDRWLSWPDAPFVEHDLYDLPTIIVTAEVVGSRLSINLGACNLGGDNVVRPLSQVAWTELPDAGYWSEARLSALEATSRIGFRRPAHLDSQAAQHLLQLEWATRVSLVAVVATVDAYHLMRSVGYREQLDDAVQQLGPDLAVPIRTSMPDGAVADPAYHLLHQARRQLAGGLPDAAAQSLTAALENLSDYRQLTPVQAILAARSVGKLEPWHEKFLEELAASAGGDALVPTEVVEALHQQLPREVVSAVASQAHSARPLEGRVVPKVHNYDPDAPPGKW